MKLASLRLGRDGCLVVVSRDLARCVPAATIAPTLQAALDDWELLEPRLHSLAVRLESGDMPGDPFDEAACAAPLPRAYQWGDGSAYLNHVELIRRARGATVPETFHADPLLYQGGSDAMLGPRDPIPLPDEAWGGDFEGARSHRGRRSAILAAGNRRGRPRPVSAVARLACCTTGAARCGQPGRARHRGTRALSLPASRNL